MITGSHCKVCVVLSETFNCLSSWPHYFVIPPAKRRSCSTSKFVVSVPDLGHSNRCVVVSQSYFNLHPLITYEVGDLFMCLFVVCFLTVDFKISFIRCVFANFSFQSAFWHLIPLTLSFGEQKCSILMKSSLLMYSVMDRSLDIVP